MSLLAFVDRWRHVESLPIGIMVRVNPAAVTIKSVRYRLALVRAGYLKLPEMANSVGASLWVPTRLPQQLVPLALLDVACPAHPT